MGKIIEFPQKSIVPEHLPQTEGMELYFRFYKNCSGQLKEWILEKIGEDIAQTWNNRNFWKTTDPEDALELIGYASAKKILKTTKATADYYKKLSEIIEKYGLEVLKSAKTN
jgi:hypothetical protein